MSEPGKAKKTRPTRQPSPKWMTFREVADYFRVSEATVRLGRGVFARLRRVPLTENRIVVLRADFEKLDREMEQASVALQEDEPKRA
jgi:hypothetical protein